jgi:Na+-driven multidrug efflux pump
MVTLMFSLSSLWVARVPLAVFLSRHFSLGMTGIWIAMAAGFVVTSGVSYLCYLSGRWKKTAGKILAPVDESVQAALEI